MNTYKDRNTTSKISNDVDVDANEKHQTDISRLFLSSQYLRDGFKKKKKLKEFSIFLAGWGLDAPVFH